MSEAFVYLWYDAPNKMYYLGSHLGSPEDTYTHSSTIWESFTKNNIPEGVTRRILAYGTHEEMCDLEIKLLKNRKERCWERYFNVAWHTKAIGNLNDILSEEKIILWKKRISESSLGKPKPNKENYQWSKTKTDEERKQFFSRPLEQNGRWKGGVSIGDNRKTYFQDDYACNKELGMKLHNEGYSYDEIKSMYPKAVLPYGLWPQEKKDRKNRLKRDRYEYKRECYCRKSSCEYCSELLLTPECKSYRKKQRYAKKKTETQGEGTLKAFLG